MKPFYANEIVAKTNFTPKKGLKIKFLFFIKIN